MVRGYWCAFAIAVLCSATGRADQTYVWPLDIPRVLTSSFAEYRDRGFHMGIDLRTGGIGRDVRALADGEVVRIRTSPNGYGKVVYLKLKNDYMVIYAHLSAFAPPLDEYVRAAQHVRKAYEVDLYPKAGQFPVTAGAFIAKSGQTGIGAPHLHFEIRDPQGHPISPRQLDITWPDRAPPEIRSVLVVPATPRTTINGDIVPVVLEARRNARGDYECDGVAFNGAIAFGVEAIDRDSAPSTRLGVAKVRTSTGDRDLFALNNERVSYARNRDGAVVYHPYFFEQGRFLVQWRWPGNDTEIYEKSPATGMLYSTEPPGTVQIQVADFLENAVTVTVPVRSEASRAFRIPHAQKATQGRVTFDTQGTWLTVTATFDGDERHTPFLNLGLPREKIMPLHRIDERTFRRNFLPTVEVKAFEVSVRHPRLSPEMTPFYAAWRGDPERVVDFGGLTVTILPGSPYGLMLLRADPVEVTSTRELRPRGDAYTLWHPATPVDEPIELAFAADPEWERCERIAVFRRNGAPSGWERLPTEFRDGKFHAEAVKLGTFALMEDVVRPSIANLRPQRSPNSRRPQIQATVDDQGSGIAKYSIAANGKWLLAELDPERRLLAWARDEELTPGKTELEFQVEDAAGNVARRTVDIVVPGP